MFCLFPVLTFEGFPCMVAPSEKDAKAKMDLMSQSPQESM